MQDCVKTGLDAEAFFDDGDKDINRDGDPDLRAHGVLGCSIEGLDAQVLLNPFEEQLDLPAAAIEFGDAEGGQREVVAEEDEILFRLCVKVAHAAQLPGIDKAGVFAIQQNRLIANQAGGFVDGMGVEPSKQPVGAGADDEECAGEIEGEQPGEVDIAAVHNVEGAGFRDQHIKRLIIGAFTVCNVDKAGDLAAQVEQGVQFDSRLGGLEFGPREHRQAQIDGGGIESVNGLLEFDAEVITRIQAARDDDERLGEVGVDAPIARLIGVGERGSRETWAPMPMW